MDNNDLQLNTIAFLGKLPNSSYYDKPNKKMDPNKSIFVDSSDQMKLSSPQSPNQRVNPNDPNIYVKTCVFSPSASHMAWTSGYEIVKIFKFRDSPNLRSFAFNETNFDDTSRSNNFNKGDICEVKCFDNVKSLAFGSSDPQDNCQRIHHRDKKTNTRLNIHNNNLILAIGLQNGRSNPLKILHHISFKSITL